MTLIPDEKPQRLQIALPERPGRLDQLGSSSEAESFRVEVRHRLFIVGLSAGGARVHLDGNDRRTALRQDLDFGQQPRRDGVAYDVGDSLLNIENI